MNKTKKIVVVAAVLLVGIFIGIATAYFLGIEKNEANNDSGGPAETRNNDSKIPEDTISPHEAAGNPQKYLDKQIKVRGLITKIGDDKFIIVSQNPNESIALNLDFSNSNIDPNNYSNPAASPDNPEVPSGAKLKDPVTIVGKLTENKGENNIMTISFVVESIE